MSEVLFKGWRVGLQKVALTKLFKQKADLRLKEAKRKTDALLDGETFIVEIRRIEQASDLVNQATALGAVCEIIEAND